MEVGSFELGPSPFCFCNSWLFNKECCWLIERSLTDFHSQGWVGYVIPAKLRKLKIALKTWQTNYKIERRRKEEHILQKLENLESSVEDDESHIAKLSLRLALKAEFLKILKEDERNLIQKSKLNWLKLGDENTSFFHRFLAAKKRKNLISELINDHGHSTTSFREIEVLILNF